MKKHMKKHIILTLLITLLSIGTVTSVYASTSAALAEDNIIEAIQTAGGDSYNPPFGKNIINENISTSTGNLSITQTDLVLPGKNGHDLVLKREYSNQNTSDYIVTDDRDDIDFVRVAYLYNGSNGIGYYILFDTEEEMLEKAPNTININPASFSLHMEPYNFAYHEQNGVGGYRYDILMCYDNTGETIELTRDTGAEPIYYTFYNETYLEKNARGNFYDIGHNWKLQLPYLDEIDKLTIPKINFTRYKWIGEFNNGEGGIYTYNYGADRDDDGDWWPPNFGIYDTYLYGTECWMPSDLQTDETGITYNRIVTDKNGKKMYFNKRGAIEAIDDKYGNRIRFEYNGTKLSKIIDTYGREVNIGTDEEGYINSISIGEKTINYEKSYRESDKTNILKVTDTEGNQTTYESAKKELYYTSIGDYPYEYKSTAYNIEKIIYPTGAYTKYNYFKKLIYLYRYREGRTKYKIDSKKDVNQSNTMNHYTYSYNYPGKFGDYEGRSPDRIDYDDNYTFTGTVTRENNGNTYTDEYNEYSKKIKTTIIGSDGYKNEATYQYGSNRPESPPITITEKQYNTQNGSAYIQTTTTYAYDGRQNITKETKGDYTVDYTYGTYSIMLTQTYKRDATHETHIENTLYNNTANPDDPLNGKCVEWTKTYERIYNSAGTQTENNLKSQKQYEYDQNGNITAIHEWDDEGNETITHSTHTYNANKTYKQETYVANVTDADGQNPQTIKQTNNYDIYGNLATTKDGNNNQTSYTYDKLGRVKTETNPDGTTKTYTYNDTQNNIIVQNENGNKQKIQYDGLGNLKATYIYNPDNSTWQKQTSYTYDNIGRKQTETLYRKYSDAGQIQEKYTITYTYNSDDTVNTQTTKDISGNIIKKITYTYDYAVNDTINGATEKYNRIAIQQEGDSTITPAPIKQYYDKWGKLVKQEVDHIENGTTKTYTTTYQYDNIGNKIAEKDARAYDENWTQEATATYTYDYANRIIEQTNAENQSINTTYDTLGRLKTQTDSKGNTTTYTYDKLGRLIQTETPFDNSNTTKTKHYYDNNGNTTKEKQQTNKPGEPENYHTTEYEYDSRNRLIKIIKHDTDGTKNYTQYHYDAVGNKTKMFTGLNAAINTTTETGTDTDYSVTRYSYNHLNQLTTMIDPIGQNITYKNDMTGNLIKQIDRNGSIITYQYNGQGKLLNQSVTKDGQTKQKTYTYDKQGNRKSMTDETGTTTYNYDDLNRLITENAPNNITKEYTYDAANNRLAFKLKQNGTEKQNISYTYDTLNRLEQVKENGSTKATYSYDANGNRQSLPYNNGNSTTYTYNKANRLTNITNKKGTTILTENDYIYYLDGNQASKTNNNGTTTYQYDGLGRLTTVTEPGNNTTTYTFDDKSNRKTKTTTNGTTIEYTYDKNNRLITETKITEGTTENQMEVSVYEYDNNGNQITKTTDTGTYTTEGENFNVYVAGETENSIITSNEYDGFNQLTKTIDDSQTITYTYNGDGLRTSKTTNGKTTNHIWDGSNIVIETNGAGTITKKYLRGINLIASDIGGTTNYYLYNGHGDVIQLTQTNGTVSKNYDYDAFGIEKNIDQNDTNPFRYCGEYYDTETGTIYLRARYYDPSMGRFITEDSYLGNNTDPLSLNLYTYCYNNPILYKDPSGHVAGVDDALVVFYLYLNAVVYSPDTQMDIEFISMDLAQGDYLGAALDTAGLLLPGATGFGRASKPVKRWLGKVGNKIDDILKFGKHFDEVIEGTVKASKASNLGKFYKGAGTVVDSSPVSKITGIYKGNTKDPYHFIDRVTERGIKPDVIMNTFRNPDVILSQWKGERFRYITDEACIVVNKDGEIITGWLKDEFGDTLKQILQEAK